MSLKFRFVSCALLFVLGSSLVPGVSLAGQATTDTHDELRGEIAFLGKQLKRSRAANDDLVVYLDAVATAYVELKGEVRVVTGLRRKIEALLLRGLSVEKISRDVNVRAPVNIRAAELLGRLAPHMAERTRARLAQTIEGRYLALRRVKHDEPSVERIHATAVVLGKLGQARSRKFLERKFLRSDLKDVQFTVGALKALLEWKQLDASARFELFEHVKRRYEGVESTAKQSSNSPAVQSKKRVWDTIRTDVIALMQQLARTPVNKKSEALHTVAEFQAWFRHNDNVRSTPWTLPKPASAVVGPESR